MGNLGSKFAWVKKKELGLPLGVWAAIAAVLILYVYRRHKAAGGTSSSSSTNPNAADSAASPSGGGGADNTSNLEAIANELALENQVLGNILDRLQGGKHKHKKPHRRKHHPKGSRPPRHRKNPVTTKHTRGGKVHKHRHPHQRSGPAGARGPLGEENRRPLRPTTHTARSMGVKPGGIRKQGLGLIPKREVALAHHRGEFDPNVEHTPELADVSFTRGVSTTAKQNPQSLPEQHSHESIHAHHPAFTKARKH